MRVVIALLRHEKTIIFNLILILVDFYSKIL